jgi:hypothetical protein
MRNPKERGKKKTQKKTKTTTNDQTDNKTLQKLPQQNSQLLEFAKGNNADRECCKGH